MDALKSILEAYKEEEVVNQLQLFFGTGVETIETIPAVMTIVMLAKGDPYKAAEISANIGGDTDTIGAISTAICGALNPIFEESVISVLEAVNDIGFEELSTRLMMYSN